MKVKIDKIIVEAIADDSPDTSWLGEYTDDLKPGVIIREYGEFYEKLKAPMERDYDGRFLAKGIPELPPKRWEFRGFIPYAGGEKQGTKEYYKYGMQDFKRMEGLNSGDWYFVGIQAKAHLSYSKNGHSRLEWLTSGGLWGIESDSGEYLNEVAKDELADLKNHLEQFNVDLSNFDELTKNFEIEWR